MSASKYHVADSKLGHRVWGGGWEGRERGWWGENLTDGCGGTMASVTHIKPCCPEVHPGKQSMWKQIV